MTNHEIRGSFPLCLQYILRSAIRTNERGGAILIGEIFEWILFGFFCILGVITTICESKGIFDPAAIKSTQYFYILLDWKTITALAVISGIYVLWKYIGAYGVLIAAGYLLCVLLIRTCCKNPK